MAYGAIALTIVQQDTPLPYESVLSVSPVQDS